MKKGDDERELILAYHFLSLTSMQEESTNLVCMEKLCLGKVRDHGENETAKRKKDIHTEDTSHLGLLMQRKAESVVHYACRGLKTSTDREL